MTSVRLFLLFIYCFFVSCLVPGCSCQYAYKYNYGKNVYQDIKEDQFTISVMVSQAKDQITIDNLTKYNAPGWIKDTISKVNFIRWQLSFPDNIILEEKIKYDPNSKRTYKYYTHTDFYTYLKKSKFLNLKVTYELDSIGIVSNYIKEYTLERKKYCQFSVH